MEYLDINDIEWHQMWRQVSNYSLNNGDQLCINKGRSWEYLGSTRDHHHLRHACHPLTGNKEYIYLERTRTAAGWS